MLEAKCRITRRDASDGGRAKVLVSQYCLYYNFLKMNKEGDNKENVGQVGKMPLVDVEVFLNIMKAKIGSIDISKPEGKDELVYEIFKFQAEMFNKLFNLNNLMLERIDTLDEQFEELQNESEVHKNEAKNLLNKYDTLNEQINIYRDMQKVNSEMLSLLVKTVTNKK
jgi:hypothetical protein